MNFKLFAIFVVAVFIATVSMANAAPSDIENKSIGKKQLFCIEINIIFSCNIGIIKFNTFLLGIAMDDKEAPISCKTPSISKDFNCTLLCALNGHFRGGYCNKNLICVCKGKSL